MADEPIKPNPPVDVAALMAEVEALRKSWSSCCQSFWERKAYKIWYARCR